MSATLQMMWKTPPMRRRIALTTIVFGTLAVSGCALFPGEQALPTDLFAAARQSERAPDAFNNALPRKSCGDITLDQGKKIPTNAVECINAAIGSLEAELAVVSLTTEGDPIVAFYRTAAGTLGVEIFTDGEFDRFGPKTWSHQNCPQTTNLMSPLGCAVV